MSQWPDPGVKVGMGDGGGAGLRPPPLRGALAGIIRCPRSCPNVAEGPEPWHSLGSGTLQEQCDPWTGAAPEPGVTEPNLRPVPAGEGRGLGRGDSEGGGCPRDTEGHGHLPRSWAHRPQAPLPPHDGNKGRGAGVERGFQPELQESSGSPNSSFWGGVWSGRSAASSQERKPAMSPWAPGAAAPAAGPRLGLERLHAVPPCPLPAASKCHPTVHQPLPSSHLCAAASTFMLLFSSTFVVVEGIPTGWLGHAPLTWPSAQPGGAKGWGHHMQREGGLLGANTASDKWPQEARWPPEHSLAWLLVPCCTDSDPRPLPGPALSPKSPSPCMVEEPIPSSRSSALRNHLLQEALAADVHPFRLPLCS